MARTGWRAACGGMGAACLMAVTIATFGRAAEDSDPAAEHPFAEPTDSRPQRVILLNSGRVILGEVVDRPGGYLIHEKFGSAVVPHTQVRLTAVDLPDAYRKLRQSLKAPTAGQHLQLAEWCYDNQLYGSAQFEVKQALMLEPERKDARDFLRKLQRTLETGEASGRASRSGADKEDSADPAFPGQAWKSYAQQKKRDALPSGEPVSTAGLSPETVQTFVRNVQPLLMNKCGNARCHGQASQSEFQLSPVRRGMGGFRAVTEENLAAVLQELDLQNPHDSQLLSVLEGPHAGSVRDLFSGPSADVQRTALRDWVRQAAAGKARHTLSQGRTIAAETDSTAAEETESTTGIAATPRQDPFLQDILAEERPDAFDPNVFNRLTRASAPPAGQFK